MEYNNDSKTGYKHLFSKIQTIVFQNILANKTLFIPTKIKYNFYDHMSQNLKEHVKRTLSNQNT